MKTAALLNTAVPAAVLPQALVGQPLLMGAAGDFALTLALLPGDAAATVPLEPAAPVTVPTTPAPVAASEQIEMDQPLDPGALAALGLLPMQQALPLPFRQAEAPPRAPLPSASTPPAALPQIAKAQAQALPIPPVLPPAAAAAVVVVSEQPASIEFQQLLERLTAQPSEFGAAPLPAEPGQSFKLEAGAPALALKGEPRQWQQPLMQALGDRLQVQIASRSEQAVIRLDPPLLGQVEIAIRQQAGELQVRMSASHGEVARQLHQLSDTLRQDLVQRHSGEVTVLVTQSTRAADETRSAGREPQSQQQQQQHAQEQREQQQRRPGRGLGDEARADIGFTSSLNADDTPV